MPSPLISIGRLRDSGVVFSNEKKSVGTLRSPDGNVILEVPMEAGVYPLRTLMQAHARLGHVAPDGIRKMAKDGLIAGLNIDVESEARTCDSCMKGKQTRNPVAKEHLEPRSKALGEFIHSDVWGPAQIEATHHADQRRGFGNVQAGGNPFRNPA